MGWGGGGVNFIIISNPTSIEVVLSCIEVVVGVLTTCSYIVPSLRRQQQLISRQVASLSWPELGTAQPQLVKLFFLTDPVRSVWHAWRLIGLKQKIAPLPLI